MQKARQIGEDVHEVTQLTLSLLGLIVFPWQDSKVKKSNSLLTLPLSKSLQTLQNEGWPAWQILKDDQNKPTANLGRLIEHLRNASAHYHIEFSSDSRKLEEVEMTFEDYKNDAPTSLYWRSHISAKDLLIFCVKFADMIDGTLG